MRRPPTWTSRQPASSAHCLLEGGAYNPPARGSFNELQVEVTVRIDHDAGVGFGDAVAVPAGAS